jgi:hypothetical protein
MAEKISAGKDIDALCTRCKLLLAHTIIALVDGVPVKVKCNTCHTDRVYRAPKGTKAPAVAKASPAAPKSAVSSTKSGAKPSSRSTSPVITAHQLEEKWLDVLGSARRGAALERAFDLTATFRAGEVILHSKFGPGVVTAVEGNRMTVIFRDGDRQMGHARPAV